MLKFRTFCQVIQYSVVGILSNLLGYLIYLLATFFGLDPKVAITIFYPIGASIAYFCHSKYSFLYQGKNSYAVLRYFLAHFIGYGVNFTMILVLVDKLQFPHQAVQGLAIFVVAGILFLLFKYFVFPPSEAVKLNNCDVIN